MPPMTPIPLEAIEPILVHRVLMDLRIKRLVLIRPNIPNDDYTNIGSYVWAGAIKQYALDKGWQVRDMAGNNANRTDVEDTIDDFRPTLVLHYDHGSTFTQWGQDNNLFDAVIDANNVGLLTNRVASTVSCHTATGLGPLAINSGSKAYLGYDDTHVFVIPRAAEFGAASNAANRALLECKRVEEAYAEGLAAYDRLINDMIDANDWFSAFWALHDRVHFVLLGNERSNACPRLLWCRRALPEPEPFVCTVNPPFLEAVCRPGLPHEPMCSTGQPDLEHIDECSKGGPDGTIPLCNGLPMDCRAGPYYREMCTGGPIIMIDPEKVPKDMRKPVRQMMEKMRKESTKRT